MTLQNKNAVIYGAGGGIGGAVAAAFARDGARVHLTGRDRARLEALAASLEGDTEVAVVDALDEEAVAAHAQSVVDTFGSLDVSLNLVSRGDVQGAPLTEMPVEDLMAPVTTGIRTNFITARTAARHMSAQGSGVIIALNSGSGSAPSPMMGGTGPADASQDSLVRNLAHEVGPAGVRVLGVWVAGIPETLTAAKLGAVNPAMGTEEALQGVLEHLASLRLTRRSPRLAEVADTIAFLASDRAAGITGTFVNATSMF